MPLDSSRFERRLNDVKQMLQDDVPAIAEVAGESVRQSITANSPTHDEEYGMIMVGEGGVLTVPLTGDRSGDTDNRIRFQKAPGTWLQDIAASGENTDIEVNGTLTTVKFGNVALLEASSIFRYTNIGKDKVPIEHESGPYFDAFENGASYVVVPTHVTNKVYPLRPDEEQKVFEFPKSVRAFRAYLPETLYPIFREQVISGLSDLNFNVA